jgi:hypothetical protein
MDDYYFLRGSVRVGSAVGNLYEFRCCSFEVGIDGSYSEWGVCSYFCQWALKVMECLLISVSSTRPQSIFAAQRV